MLHLIKAITQIKKEIRDLEAGKVSIDELIKEKIKTLHELQPMLLGALNEKGNTEGESSKET